MVWHRPRRPSVPTCSIGGTKASGVWVHARHKNIDWKITGLLSLGGVPAAALTLWFLNTLHTDTSALNAIIISKAWRWY